MAQFTERASDDFTLYLFTDDDLRDLLQEAYSRRIPDAAAPAAPSAPGRRLNTDRLVAPPTIPPSDPVAPAADARGEAVDAAHDAGGGRREESAVPFQTLLSRVNARGANQ